MLRTTRGLQGDKDGAEELVQLVPDAAFKPSWHGGAKTPYLDARHTDVGIVASYSKFPKRVLSDLFCFTIPALYLGLAAAVIVLNGQPLKNRRGEVNVSSHALSEAITVAVTLFPIAFGVLVTRFLKTWARFKAEKGTRLMTLEQILCGKSVETALMSFCQLAQRNTIAVILLIIWLVSPLTTQALQRVFSSGNNSYGIGPYKIEYGNLLNNNPYILQPHEFLQRSKHFVPPIFVSALLQSSAGADLSAVDQFGNPKIPLLDSVGHLLKETTGWYATEDLYTSSNFPKWSSNLGIPLAGVPNNASSFDMLSNLTVETAYWTLTCSPWVNYTVNAALEKWPKPIPNCVTSGCSVLNSTSYTFWISAPEKAQTSSQGLPHVTFGFHTVGNDATAPDAVSVTTCGWQRKIINANIACSGRSCQVVRMQESSSKLNSPIFIASYQTVYNLLVDFVEMNAPQSRYSWGAPQDYSPFEYWLMNPAEPLDLHVRAILGVARVPMDIFQQRLNVAWNTFYQALILTSLFQSSLPDDFPESYPGTSAQTVASVTKIRAVYQCHWGWLAMVLIACVTSLALILANMVLSADVHGPDVLGFVSSMTRDNRFLSLPEEGSMMDGMTRAKHLANLKVRLQDVAPGEDTGYVALSNIAGGLLRKKRKYR